MRIWIKRMTGWIHASLILAFILPVLYAFPSDRSSSNEQKLFFLSLMVMIPVALTELAIKGCKSIALYLIISVSMTLTVTWAAVFLATSLPEVFQIIFPVFLAAVALLLVVERLLGRLNLKEKQETREMSDPDWRPDHNLFEAPRFPFLGWFVVMYLLGLCVNSPVLCNEAVVCAVIYFFATLLYGFVESTEQYLNLNHRVSHLPGRRLYGISGVMLLICIGMLAVVLLPTFLTMNSRTYTDVRKWVSEVRAPVETNMNQGKPSMPDFSALQKLAGEQKETAQPSWIAEHLFNLLLPLILIAAVIMICRSVKQISRDFRKTYDENGDLVEELAQTFAESSGKGTHRKTDSEREKVRKLYRKTIRRHRKEKPWPYEAPLEIEQKAGIADLGETQELHNRYEFFRYGKHPE